MEKAMAPHSSTLAWKIPWMEEPGRLQSMGSLSRTWLSDFTFTFHFHALEKEMATHSSVLAWRIPGTGEPGRLPSMGSHSRTQLTWLRSSSKALGTNKHAEWEAGLSHNLKNSPHSEVPKRRCQQRINKWLVGRREFQEQNGKLCWKLLRDLVRQDGNVLIGGRDT